MEKKKCHALEESKRVCIRLNYGLNDGDPNYTEKYPSFRVDFCSGLPFKLRVCSVLVYDLIFVFIIHSYFLLWHKVGKEFFF